MLLSRVGRAGSHGVVHSALLLILLGVVLRTPETLLKVGAVAVSREQGTSRSSGTGTLFFVHHLGMYLRYVHLQSL